MAIKTYRVSCQCDLCADKILVTEVKANTKRKAIMKAEEKWKKDGHKYIWINSVEEIIQTKLVD